MFAGGVWVPGMKREPPFRCLVQFQRSALTKAPRPRWSQLRWIKALRENVYNPGRYTNSQVPDPAWNHPQFALPAIL
jgi:hypothetical protein